MQIKRICRYELCSKEVTGHKAKLFCCTGHKTKQHSINRKRAKEEKLRVCEWCGEVYQNKDGVVNKKYCTSKACKDERRKYENKKNTTKYNQTTAGKEKIEKWNRYNRAKERVIGRKSTIRDKFYSDAEIEVLRDKSLNAYEVSEKIGRTVHSVRSKRRRLRKS